MEKHFRQFGHKDNEALEDAYQKYLRQPHSSFEDFGRMFVGDDTEVNFATNRMIKPRNRYIKRTFQTGLWVQMKTSSHQLQLHVKLNRLQIDNQIYGCTFPVVLAPVPPPKSVASGGNTFLM